jgi:hypothetical protein
MLWPIFKFDGQSRFAWRGTPGETGNDNMVPPAHRSIDMKLGLHLVAEIKLHQYNHVHESATNYTTTPYNIHIFSLSHEVNFIYDTLN